MVTERRAHGSPPARDFGQRLRAAREKRGVSIRDISRTTKIPAAILEGLEKDDPSKLPGGLYSRSFVRSIASEVGLDPEETLREFQRAFPDHAPQTDVPVEILIPHSREQERRARPVVFLVVLMTVAGGATLLYKMWEGAGSGVGAGAAVAPGEPGKGPEPSPRRTAEPAPSDSTQRAATMGVEPRSEAGVAEAGPEAAGPAATVAPAAGPLRIAIHPKGECWVRLIVDGQAVLVRLMRPGERVEHEAMTAIQLEVGDAGAFDFSINGAPGRRLGGAGQVVRARIDHENIAEFLGR